MVRRYHAALVSHRVSRRVSHHAMMGSPLKSHVPLLPGNLLPASGPVRATSAAVLSVVAGLVLIIANGPIARILARGLPWRGEVKSAGTFFPPFPEAAPVILSRTGWMLIALPVLTAATVSATSRLKSDRRVDIVVATTTIIGSGLWFGWLATPHNAFPSNARIHWVDYLTWRTERLFYAAGRVPHMLFYDSPPTWQAINAALLVGLCILIARRLGFSMLASSALSIVVATSGNLLRFANTAEDVFINLTLVLIVVYASLGRRSVLFGVALAALLLGRPQFIVIFPAVAMSELLVAARQRRLPDREQLRHVCVTIGAAVVGVVATQIFFEVIGERYFFHNGKIVDVGTLESVSPREIDGFTISAFSGTYVLHFVWALPTITVALALLAAVRAPALGTPREAPVYFWGLSVSTLVLLHEAQPLLYFNIRYLTYTLPFLLVMSWALIRTVVERRANKPVEPATAGRDGRFGVHGPDPASPNRPGWSAVGAGCFWLTLLAPITIPGDPVDTKQRLERRPEIELLEIRDELRELADGRTVYLDFPSTSTQNYVTYVLRTPVRNVRLLSDSPFEEGGIVIGTAADPWSDQAPALSTDRLVVFDPSADDTLDGGD